MSDKNRAVAQFLAVCLNVGLLTACIRYYPTVPAWLIWAVMLLYSLELMTTLAKLASNFTYVKPTVGFIIVSTLLEVPLCYILFSSGHPVPAALVASAILKDYLY